MKRKYIAINVKRNVRQKIKIIASIRDIPISKYIEELVDQDAQKYNMPQLDEEPEG